MKQDPGFKQLCLKLRESQQIGNRQMNQRMRIVSNYVVRVGKGKGELK